MTILSMDDIIANLEHEHKCMRARMDRLEDEVRDREEVIHKLKMRIQELERQLKGE